MPFISIELHKADQAMKKNLIEDLTKTASEVTGIPESSFNIHIKELPMENIGIGGATLDEVIAAKNS